MSYKNRFLPFTGRNIDGDADVIDLDSQHLVTSQERRQKSMPNEPRISLDLQVEETLAAKSSLQRILVVDDNVDAANILSELLRVMGYDVSTEFHPHAALSRTTSERFDAFLLDIGLPDIDGHQLARELRARSLTAKSLYIAVTGYNNEDDRRRSAEAGFHHHFSKPVNLAALLAALGPPIRLPTDT